MKNNCVISLILFPVITVYEEPCNKKQTKAF